MRIDVCDRLPANHLLQPPMIEPLQSIPVDAEVGSEQAVPEPNIPETSSSQLQPSTQTSDPSIVDELANHYQGELPGFEPNLENAFEIASDEVTLESRKQQEPNLKMAANTCTELIIHPEYQPYHLNATHSNISFGIALRKLANKKSSTPSLPSSDDQPSSSAQPISVALPSTEPTLNPVELEQVIIEHAVDEVPTNNGTTLPSLAPFILEHINDPPSVPNRPVATKSTSTTLTTAEPTSMLTLGEPSSSNSTQLTDITFPPTLLLDSIILKEVCKNIFKDLNKLVKTRNNLVHEEDYVSEWTSLRSRVDYMMCELQKLSLEAHDKVVLDLQQWFQGVTVNLEKVELNRSLERSRLYLSDTPMYLDASSIILSSVHSDNPDLSWLTKLKIQTSDAPILKKLQDDPVFEKENKELKKALFEHKILVVELQRKMIV